MPSNASKEWSGTRADYARKQKLEMAIARIIRKHRKNDSKKIPIDRKQAEQKQIDRLIRTN